MKNTWVSNQRKDGKKLGWKETVLKMPVFLN
jgi:hypothetical protein